jgi:hypothetical protein
VVILLVAHRLKAPRTQHDDAGRGLDRLRLGTDDLFTTLLELDDHDEPVQKAEKTREPSTLH